MKIVSNPNTFSERKFMDAAYAAAAKSSCIRSESRIGCVAVRHGQIIASGFNAVVGNIPPCSTRGYCIRESLKIPSGEKREVAYCICAEQRMICDAAEEGVKLKDATVYVTHMPCAVCLRLLIEAGVACVYYHNEYANAFAREITEISGFKVNKIEKY